MEQYECMDDPRAVVSGSAAATAIVWVWWLVDPTAPASPGWPAVASALLAANVPFTLASPRAKRVLVGALHRWLLNPAVRALFRIGVVPFGFALLETVGRRSASPRRVPVGNGLDGRVFWVIAEHGVRSGYVRNLIANPRVRVRVRCGLRFVWHNGTATVMFHDDPLARQREICRWHPLRALNAVAVRTLGTDLLTVRIVLDTTPSAAGPRTLDSSG
jgi:deazaflavin-dependent oxidoreductase (nitroreductase family)